MRRIRKSNATAMLVSAIKPIAGKFNETDFSEVFKLEDRYYEKEEIVELHNEYYEFKNVIGNIDLNYPSSFMFTFSVLSCKDFRLFTEHIGFQDCIELYHNMMESVEEFLKYLLECFDDSVKLQEAISKGLIESYK